MAYPDTITVVDASIDGGTSRSVNTISWLAAQLTPLLTTIRDNGIALNSYSSTFTVSYLASAAASKNPTVVKASGGAIVGIQGYNAAATGLLLHLYDKVTAPLHGTDTPKKVLYLPATAAFAFDFSYGAVFATGIGYAITTLAGAAVAAGDILHLNVDNT